jgi:UDP-N-acetylmuramyl pentapeptide phosphotransferase/UDP-N-acetylglucosamine-1-phosphate transferase
VNALWVAAILPALIAFCVIAALRKSRLAVRLADKPNERSLHTAPTARLGGAGMALAVAPFAAALAQGPLAAAFGAAAALALVSLADDVRSLPVEVRLPAHALAAIVFVLALPQPPAIEWPWGWFGAALAAVGLVWAANLFNFMDGADGLAGGMAAIGFGVLAAGAAQGGFIELAVLCSAIASAAAGFLAWNFPPARVFMGDAGSIPLGFLAGALGTYGVLAGAWPAWFPLLVFSPFVVDATLTLARRAAQGERIWIAHRSHAYQRLVLSGWSHRRLAIAAYALMGAAGASALAARAGSAMVQCGILFVWAAAYALLVAAIRSITRRKA